MNEGVKHDQGKLPWTLVPWDAMRGIVSVLKFGAAKYGERNWERGMAWSRFERAAINHITSWSLREDHDEETKLSHLLHAGCCILFLIAYELRGIGIDDRPILVKKAPNHDEKSRHEELKKVASEYLETWGIEASIALTREILKAQGHGIDEGQGKAPVAVVEAAREVLKARAGVPEAEPLVINEAGFLKDEIRARGEANIAAERDAAIAAENAAVRAERAAQLARTYPYRQNRLWGRGPVPDETTPVADDGRTVSNRVAVVGTAATVAAAVAKRATHYGLSGIKPSPSSEGSDNDHE